MSNPGDNRVTRPHRPVRRTAAPVVRATFVIGTFVALVASVGAPFKWY